MYTQIKSEQNQKQFQENQHSKLQKREETNRMPVTCRDKVD